MAWTDIPDKSTGDLMDETWYQAHFKANLEYLKALADNLRGGAVVVPFFAGSNLQPHQHAHTSDTLVNGSQHAIVPDALRDAGVYFEVVMYKDSSGTAYASLYVDGSKVSQSELSTNSTSYVRLRSNDLAAALPAGDSPVPFECRVRVNSGFGFVASARLLIVPGG